MPEAFYTITGEALDRENFVQMMIDSFNEKYPDSEITDFNEGSEIRNLLEAIATDIYHLEKNDQQILQVCFLSTSYGRYLDLFGVDLNAPRSLGSYAWGTVTFSIPEAVDYQIEIPYGTLLRSSDTGVNYITNLTGVIPIGATSVDVPAYSQLPGANTNAEANTITIIADTPVYNLLSVNNVEAFSGGSNPETDDEYRERLLAVKNEDSFGSKDYYSRLGNEVDGVHDVYITESATKTGKIIVNTYEKPVPDNIFTQVVSVYNDEVNLVYNHSFEVVKTSYTTVDLEITVLVSDEVTETEFTKALTCLFNSGEYQSIPYNGLSINTELNKYQIMTIIETIPGVLQVTDMTRDGESFNKITPDTNTVLKLGDVTITQTDGD